MFVGLSAIVLGKGKSGDCAFVLFGAVSSATLELGCGGAGSVAAFCSLAGGIVVIAFHCRCWYWLAFVGLVANGPWGAFSQAAPYGTGSDSPNAVVVKNDADASGAKLSAKLRRPIGLALSPKEEFLYVANGRGGSITVLDVATRKVLRETPIGGRLSDFVTFAHGKLGLVTDEAKHELLLLKIDGAEVAVAQRLPVSPFPVGVVVPADGRTAFISSLWSRRLTEVAIASGDSQPSLAIARVIDLDYAPRKLLLVRGDARMIVGDAFGGRIGVYDTKLGQMIGVREFPAHNIRGFATAGNEQMLVMSHQMLNELAHSIRNDVHWGLLMSNDLRWLRLESVLAGASNLYTGAHMHPLGEAGSATADPGGLTMTAAGDVVVTLSGVGEIAFGKEKDFSLRRIKVGLRPTAVVASADNRRVFVANTFGDSISIVDIEQAERLADITLGPQAELSLVDRGELLFYDGELSHDRWMSCHSCHTDGHTNGFMNDNFSDDSFGAPKQVLSLLGKADTAPFAWNAEVKTLEQQIRNSIEKTMQIAEPPSDEQVAALKAFVESLPLPPSVDALRNTIDRPAVERGGKLFASLGCVNCHAPPTYTTPDVYDVGMEDKLGNRKFNPPSLRGVGQRGPYFHDNRAKTLRDVFAEHQHQIDRPLTDAELADLLAFLRSL